jgi:phage tail sheath protein FI
MVCYIKQQLREIGNRYKYEPNTAAMRESFTKEVLDLLREIQRTSGISDYNVLCDNTNNTVETIDRHELHMKVAIKPIKAIEYIIIDLDVINGSSEMEENMVIIND